MYIYTLYILSYIYTQYVYIYIHNIYIYIQYMYIYIYTQYTQYIYIYIYCRYIVHELDYIAIALSSWSILIPLTIWVFWPLPGFRRLQYEATASGRAKSSHDAKLSFDAWMLGTSKGPKCCWQFETSWHSARLQYIVTVHGVKACQSNVVSRMDFS